MEEGKESCGVCVCERESSFQSAGLCVCQRVCERRMILYTPTPLCFLPTSTPVEIGHL